MRRIIALLTIVPLMLMIVVGFNNEAIDNKGEEEKRLQANFDFSVEDNFIIPEDRSTSDFENVKYFWILLLKNKEGDTVLRRRTVNRKPATTPVPNTYSASLELKLVAGDNTSSVKKELPTNYLTVETKLDKKNQLLKVSFPEEADEWALVGERIKIASHNFLLDQSKKEVSFDIDKIKEYEKVKVVVRRKGWFSNYTTYVQELNSTFDGELIKTSSDKKAHQIRYTIDGNSFEKTTHEYGHSSQASILTFHELYDLEPGTYDCTVQAYDKEMNNLYPEPETLEVTLNPEIIE